jgi:hypothetical protein
VEVETLRAQEMQGIQVVRVTEEVQETQVMLEEQEEFL